MYKEERNETRIAMRLYNYLIFLLFISCHKVVPDVDGTWIVYSKNNNEKKTSQLSKILFKNHSNPLIYIDSDEIEYPFGFSGLSSLEFKDNFRDYSIEDDVLKIQGDRFKINTISNDSICLQYENSPLLCVKRSTKEFNEAKLTEIRVSCTDEFFDFDLLINSTSELQLMRSGILSDTITSSLQEKDWDYLTKLISRISPSKLQAVYNPKASDVPEYELQLTFEDGQEMKFKANGYSALPEIPYPVSALLYNLDKISKRKDFSENKKSSN